MNKLYLIVALGLSGCMSFSTGEPQEPIVFPAELMPQGAPTHPPVLKPQ